MKFFPVSRYIVQGNSMLPKFKPNQSVICFNWAYFFSSPKIGEVVVLKHNDRPLIKRIQKNNGHHIFVIGDNPKQSKDSRQFGWINKSCVIGKVIGI